MLSLFGGSGVARPRRPASSARVFSRLAPFDLIWAAASPILAFIIRDGGLGRIDVAIVYGGIALLASVFAFQWFRISDPLPGFFSVHEAVGVVKASLATVAITTVALFLLTRLDDAPRSAPVIHLLMLAGGLIGVRVAARMVARPQTVETSRPSYDAVENVLIVGASRLSWFFIRMVEELASREQRIVALLDERSGLRHRTLNGYPIVGSPEQLARVIGEYAMHGLQISKVVVALHPAELSRPAWLHVQATCESKGIPLEWLHERFSFPPAAALGGDAGGPQSGAVAGLGMRSYWGVKRALDIVISLAMMIVIAPVAAVVAILVFIAMGSPVVFWQQRLGHHGRPLSVYKFRSMHSAFDRYGRPLLEKERVSVLGWVLRRNRLDEIPQLVNVLTGGMSIVGPRPLLPVDQPKGMGLRLQVRPGLTGLAQINGGKLLTPDEKDALDEWYIRHASFWLDLKIMILTAWVIVRGDRRNEAQVAAAMGERVERQATAGRDQGVS